MMQSETDIKIHEKIYKKLIKQDPSLIFKPRVKIFDLFQKNIKKINGKVLDIGAGSGYASIWLALNTEANEIVSIESSEICVKELIPQNVKYFKTENKISILKGNFQELNFENYFDFIVSFGSIHHSSCLYETMSALSKYLKNDGYLIMNEPSMSNFTSNEEYIKKYETEEIIEGIKIKNHERNDKFFRVSEYVTAANYNGFDLKYLEEFDFPKKFNWYKKVFTFLKLILTFNFNKLIRSFQQNLNKIQYQNHSSKPKSKIYFFQKKITTYIPHLWKKLI